MKDLNIQVVGNANWHLQIGCYISIFLLTRGQAPSVDLFRSDDEFCCFFNSYNFPVCLLHGRLEGDSRDRTLLSTLVNIRLTDNLFTQPKTE